jgi:hypothetical protein
MDAKTQAIFRQIMREIGRNDGKIGGKRSLETMNARGADRAGQESVHSGYEEANRETVGEGEEIEEAVERMTYCAMASY